MISLVMLLVLRWLMLEVVVSCTGVTFVFSAAGTQRVVHTTVLYGQGGAKSSPLWCLFSHARDDHPITTSVTPSHNRMQAT